MFPPQGISTEIRHTRTYSKARTTRDLILTRYVGNPYQGFGPIKKISILCAKSVRHIQYIKRGETKINENEK